MADRMFGWRFTFPLLLGSTLVCALLGVAADAACPALSPSPSPPPSEPRSEKLMNPLMHLVTPLGRMLRNKRPDEKLSVRHNRTLAAPRTIELTSSAFGPGGTIPDRHCSMDLGPNIAPALTWIGVPAGTHQLLFILEDIDVPMSRPALHTVALLDPSIAGLAEGELKPGHPAIRFIPTLRGRASYFGPRPLPGHGTHRYGFHLYALDHAIPADQSLTSLNDVLSAVDGHVLADGFIEGTKTA
jgi:phosphatidylethanolamine-binding protein (PEBP) family uncharacterized protein